LYTRGIEYLMKGLKYEKNDSVKDKVKEKVLHYMNRAEELKQEIADPPAKKKASAGTTGGDDDAKEEDEKLKASLQSAIVMEKPNVHWDDVAGLEVAKGLLKEAVILPIKFPQFFTGKRTPWRGILLYGPPGTGKSYLAKAVATEANNSTFFSVSSSDLVSKFLGESEKLVRDLFQMARENSPSIIFIDEIDSLCGARSDGENDSTRRIKTEFLVQMQGVGKGEGQVLVLGATNTPWDLDSAIRRRFEKRIYIPLPDAEARRVMFRLHIGDTPSSLTEQDFDELSQRTEGFSGSDLSIVVRDALMEPIRTVQTATHFRKQDDPEKKKDWVWVPCSKRDTGAQEKSLMDIESDRVRPPLVTMADFLRVLEVATSSVGEGDIRRHEDWTKEFGMES
jgi:vacuolar protein-sorting-associated protein 4